MDKELINSPDEKIINKHLDKMMDVIYRLEDELPTYLDKVKIKEDLYKSIIRNTTSNKNLCVECGEDMGINNPRQLCGKLYCYNL